MAETHYTPDPVMQRYTISCCVHCGQLPVVHTTEQRCYTPAELGARLRHYYRTGLWPEPDEALGESDHA